MHQAGPASASGRGGVHAQIIFRMRAHNLRSPYGFVIVRVFCVVLQSLYLLEFEFHADFNPQHLMFVDRRRRRHYPTLLHHHLGTHSLYASIGLGLVISANDLSSYGGFGLATRQTNKPVEQFECKPRHLARQSHQ
jgi:hypothetical protein